MLYATSGLITAFDIDSSAVGVQLDILGLWIGRRVVSQLISGVYFQLGYRRDWI